MQFSKKSSILLLTLICFAVLVSACGGNSNSNSSSGSASNQSNDTASSTGDTEEGMAESKGKKIKLTLMIASSDDKNAKVEEQLVAEHFADKYDITFKAWDVSNAEKTVKTTIASGEPLDLVMYYPAQMETFVNADMALDLTPYLEANNGEWKDTFVGNVLESGEYNGKVFAVPYAAVYPMLEVNKDILDQAGVTLPDGPLAWDEFLKALETIKEKTGIKPLGLQKDWAGWVPRNNLISVWPDDGKMNDFVKGKIPFSDPLVVKAFDASKELYDKEFVYPGKGALSTTLEQVNIAFKTGKIAIKANVNILSAQSVKDSGLNNVQIVSWPHFGPLNYVLGGSNGYMIPSNAKNPEASIEIMKYLTSAEVLQKRVDAGAPVTIKGVKSEDPNFELYAKDAANIQPKEILTLSPKLDDGIASNMPANYIFKGKASLDELEKYRLEAIQQQ